MGLECTKFDPSANPCTSRAGQDQAGEVSLLLLALSLAYSFRSWPVSSQKALGSLILLNTIITASWTRSKERSRPSSAEQLPHPPDFPSH